jgi:signal transduction histidine kinase
MPHHLKHPDRRHSVFIRLLLVLLATMGLVHVVIGSAFGLLSGTDSQNYFEANIRHYAETLAREIGSPPDTAAARRLSDTYLLYIRYESDHFQWSSYSRMPGQFKCPGSSSKWRHPVVIENEDGSRYTLFWRFGPFTGMYRQVLLGSILIVTVIFLGTLGTIRRILRPIRWLKAGVDEIGSGNLEVHIPKDRDDELGRLTEAFNHMVQRIKNILKSRDQLLLDVSHELRSPITRIRVALEFIPDSEKKSVILNDVEVIESMITDILESERLDAKHGGISRKDTDLIALLDDVIRGFKDKPPCIRTAGLPASLTLSLDAERIRMTLKNVLENAVKFSHADSRSIDVSIDTSAGRTAIQIRDDGMGIPEDQSPYVFEPFFRTDRSRSRTTGGYGLGLHLCKKIMEAHGGSIRLRNNENGRGVTVELEF